MKIFNECNDTTTNVSNLFIDNYMKDANDAQIKIYLYLIRMDSAHQEPSISDLVEKFNYTEKDIILALKYWEKNKLLKLKFDEHKYPREIHLRQIPNHNKPAMSNITPLPILEAPKDDFAKREYSLNELKAFQEKEEISQLIFVAEKYLKKQLSPTDMQTIFFFVDVLKFSGDLIDYLIQYCVERGRKEFCYIEKVAINWAEEGITTPKQAAMAARKYDKVVYDIMKALGKQASPTKVEANYIMRWISELGFNAEIIYKACERTVLAVDKHRFEYCNRILSNWKELSVHSIADIQKADAAFNRKTNAEANPKSTGKVNMFHQFKQNTYDYEALEREIFSN